MGTDVAGGDFSGTGISGYAISAWGQDNGSLAQAGVVSIYNGTTAYLTQLISNDNGHVYYAGDNPLGAALLQNGVDIIATGTGNNDWVHGIGTDTTGTTSTAVQHDAVSGGVGNDYIGIIGTNFTSVNGGSGWNTLVFEGSNLTVNLAQMGLRVQGFAQFDLNNQSNNNASDPQGQFLTPSTDNTLALRLSDVLSESNGAVGPSSQHMTILGDTSSTVQLDGSSTLAGTNWVTTGTLTVSGVVFDVYHNSSMGSNTAADLLIQQGVHVV